MLLSSSSMTDMVGPSRPPFRSSSTSHSACAAIACAKRPPPGGRWILGLCGWLPLLCSCFLASGDCISQSCEKTDMTAFSRAFSCVQSRPTSSSSSELTTPNTCALFLERLFLCVGGVSSLRRTACLKSFCLVDTSLELLNVLISSGSCVLEAEEEEVEVEKEEEEAAEEEAVGVVWRRGGGPTSARLPPASLGSLNLLPASSLRPDFFFIICARYFAAADLAPEGLPPFGGALAN